MTTINDIAREASVSTATVSHVINGTRFVSDDLRERVESAMRQLNYRPNAIAQGLRSGRTQAIGLMVPDNSNPFFAEVARAIEDRGFETGYSVILCNTDGSLDKEQAYINVLVAKHVDGVIYIATGVGDGDHLRELTEAGVPLVIADRDLEGVEATVIVVDNEHGAYEATRHLVSLGHRAIACIAGPLGLSSTQERVQGYRLALREARILEEARLLVEAEFNFSGGESAMTQLLRSEPAPTAVFACNDMMAIGALRAARSAGFRVPDDVSIVGFDGVATAEMVDPPLTTVAQPIEEIARLATNELIEQMHDRRLNVGRTEATRVVLKTRLVLRGSTAGPRRI